MYRETTICIRMIELYHFFVCPIVCQQYIVRVSKPLPRLHNGLKPPNKSHLCEGTKEGTLR